MKITAYQIAERFIGMAEAKGAVDNPQILAMLRLDATWPEHDEVPWCAAFVNFVAWLLKLPRTKSLMAKSWAAAGDPVELRKARPGFDIVVLHRGDPMGPSGHVGFFAGIEDGKVLVLGGNQGDKVSIARFPQSQIFAVRRLATD